MKNILVINMHWNNRGDEAANRAMLESIRDNINDATINIQILSSDISGKEALIDAGYVCMEEYFPRFRHIIEWFCAYLSKGYIVWSKAGKEFVEKVKQADIVIHAPGGPSIGDVYWKSEWGYFRRLLLVNRMGKKYFFYAPSAGPFNMKLRNIIRRYIYSNAAGIVFREDISARYFQELFPDKEFRVTLDAAFQNEIDIILNQEILLKYVELNEFINKYSSIIGITITDLQWNPKYFEKVEIKNKIEIAFNGYIDYLISQGYGVVFIPQLFGQQNDYNYMKRFCRDGTFIIDDKYDSYFQQYLISRLYAVVGMRYHSNIFSCKMGTPFISISYEQKMKGFMEKVRLDDYWVNVEDICEELLINKFQVLVNNYDEYSAFLKKIGPQLREESKQTTNYLLKKMEESIW